MTADGVDPGDLDAVGDYVYGLPLGEFLTARTELVKAAKRGGDKDAATQIGALRKPTVSAWAINQLVRQRPQAVDDLLTLAGQLRSAHARLDAEAMRELREDRERVLTELVTAAVQEAQRAGQPLSSAARDDIHDTAVAALADAHAAEAVTSGTLTRALHYSGFGEVDIADAVARTSTGIKLAILQGGREQQTQAATESTDDVQESLARAQRAAEREAAAQERREQRRRQQRDAAAAAVADARHRIDELVGKLAQAHEDLAQAEARLADLES